MSKEDIISIIVCSILGIAIVFLSNRIKKQKEELESIKGEDQSAENASCIRCSQSLDKSDYTE